MERSIPFDLNAERATLGSVLLERDAIVAVADWLHPTHFYLQKHEWVYAAALACLLRREPPDLATVAAELRRQDRLDAVGGLSFLGELALDVPTALHVEYYGRTVLRTAVLRRLIEAGGHISAIGYDESADLNTAVGAAEAALFAVTQGAGSHSSVPIADVVDRYGAWLQAQIDGDAQPVGIATGLIDLDALTGGLQPSDFTVIAARSGVGKSSLALSLAYHIAEQGTGVGFFSQEMNHDQLLHRLLSMHTGIDTQRLRLGRLRGDEVRSVHTGMAAVREWPILLGNLRTRTIGQVLTEARRMVEMHGMKVLVIDYLQLVLPNESRRQRNRVEEVAEITRAVKGIARDLNVPILGLSQLNREIEKRSDGVPRLSDLREGGSLEQDPDNVWFITRPDPDDERAEEGTAELHIAKHRNGPLGVIPLRFEARTTRFQSLDRYHAPEGY